MIKGVIDDVLLAVEAGASIEAAIERMIASAQQANLLTPEQVAQIRADHAAFFASDAMKTDAQILPNPSA